MLTSSAPDGGRAGGLGIVHGHVLGTPQATRDLDAPANLLGGTPFEPRRDHLEGDLNVEGTTATNTDDFRNGSTDSRMSIRISADAPADRL
jgi:hypothetical protein